MSFIFRGQSNIACLILLVACLHGGASAAVTQDDEKLSELSECAQDISRICPGRSLHTLTNLETLECVLDEQDSTGNGLSDSCNHQLWLYRKKLTDSSTSDLIVLAPPDCAKEFRNILTKNCTREEDEPVIACIINSKEDLRIEQCRHFVTRIEKVIFSDYKLMGRFAEKCRRDIDVYTCGRNEKTQDKLPHTQGRTIECLSEHVQNLTTDCAMEILRVAELQVDDFHLDRALYFACRDDRERYCPRVRAGEGRVYKCLLRYHKEIDMSDKCRIQIQRRQKLAWQDYKASGIVVSCRSEIRKFRCRRDTSTTDKVVRLSQILLCLENATHMSESRKEVNLDCIEQIKQHRRMLMEDFNITPELLSACSAEYKNHCSSKSAKKNSIHCLMELANDGRHMSLNCRARLEDIIKITDVSDDWRVDPVLEENCAPIVQRHCGELAANKVLDCLMSLLSSETVFEVGTSETVKCENTLLEIQYFMARDFPMDSALFTACAKDAEKVCKASAEWAPNPNDHGGNTGPMILSCLFRNSGSEKDSKVSSQCAAKVRETMRLRAISVRLMPEIEEACLTYLADLCPDKQKPGEELNCLQEHFEDLKGECSLAVGNFTEMEMKNPTINPYLYKYCRDIMENQCGEDKSDGTDMIECLIEKKPEIKSKKCRATIEHIQIIRVKHFNFTPKFKMQCQEPVMRYCKKERTAANLVACISEHIRNDTINETPQRISKACRKQVRNFIFSKVQLENGRLDPHSMYNMCRGSIQRLCKDVKKGGGRIFGCLISLDNREIIRNEDKTCYDALLKLQQDISALNTYGTLDLNLQSICSQEVKLFCFDQQENIFSCLLDNSLHETNWKKFSDDCMKAVRTRQIEQNSDLRLNPRLRAACKHDLPKFCARVKYGDSHALECLKTYATENNGNVLSDSCKEHVMSILENAAQVDVKIDSALYIACREDINECKNVTVGEKGDGGQVEDCLKKLFHENKLKFHSCKSQVKQLIQATLVDIHVDPVLNQACYMDLIKRCSEVPPGDSRKISCLLELLKEDKSKTAPLLSEKCRQVLVVRAEMFEQVESAKFESLKDIYQHVQKSKHKNYFLLVSVSIVGVIFIFGLYCGRATRRRTELKDK